MPAQLLATQRFGIDKPVIALDGLQMKANTRLLDRTPKMHMQNKPTTFLFLLELIEVKGFFFSALLWSTVLNGFSFFMTPKCPFSLSTQSSNVPILVCIVVKTFERLLETLRTVWMSMQSQLQLVLTEGKYWVRPMLVFMQKRWPAKWCEVSGVDGLAAEGLVAWLRRHGHGLVWLNAIISSSMYIFVFPKFAMAWFRLYNAKDCFCGEKVPSSLSETPIPP